MRRRSARRKRRVRRIAGRAIGVPQQPHYAGSRAFAREIGGPATPLRRQVAVPVATPPGSASGGGGRGGQALNAGSARRLAGHPERLIWRWERSLSTVPARGDGVCLAESRGSCGRKHQWLGRRSSGRLVD